MKFPKNFNFTNFYSKRKSKYFSEKIIVDNIVFASKKEAERYKYLKILLNAGQIKNLKVQPKFLLIDSFTYQNKKFRKTYYIADFSYEEKINNNWIKVVEDVKGYKLPVYQLKKKLFLSIYGKNIIFKEIK